MVGGMGIWTTYLCNSLKFFRLQCRVLDVCVLGFFFFFWLKPIYDFVQLGVFSYHGLECKIHQPTACAF